MYYIAKRGYGDGLHIGDSLTFKAATRYSYKKATRKIVSIDHYGRPCVRYGGWSEFIVRPNEILSVERCK